MGMWSKIGKFFKKALPVVAPLAGFIPGVGGAISSVFSGIGGGGPVELKGDGSDGSSGGFNWSSLGNAVGGLLNSDVGMAGLQGGLTYLGGRETNAAAAWEAQKNRDFQAAQAQQQMDFQAAQAQKSMDFSGGQAANQMAFQERMANTAMQRGAEDMRAAGFNPMLSFMKGGADVPSGAAGTGAMGSGASGHGAQAGVVNALGQAVSSAFSGYKMQSEVDNMRAQNQLIHAQATESQARALESATRLPKIQAETIQSQVNAEKQEFEIQSIRAGIERTEEQIREIQERVQGQRLSNEQRSYYVLFMQQLDRQVKEAQARLLSLGIPRATNEAGAQSSWWMREVSPYLPDVLKSTTSAGQLGRMSK